MFILNNDYCFDDDDDDVCVCVCVCACVHMCMPQVQETGWLNGYSVEYYTRNTDDICEMKYHIL